MRKGSLLKVKSGSELSLTILSRSPTSVIFCGFFLGAGKGRLPWRQYGHHCVLISSSLLVWMPAALRCRSSECGGPLQCSEAAVTSLHTWSPPPSAPPTSCPLGGTELGAGWSHHGIYGPCQSTQLWGIQHSRLDNSPLPLPNAKISSPFCHWEIQGPFPRLRPFKTIACLREFHRLPSSFLPCLSSRNRLQITFP